MTFDQLSNPAKVWFIVFYEAIALGRWNGWGSLARAVAKAGVPANELKPGKAEFESFLAHCQACAASAKAERRRNQQKSRK